MLESMQQMNMSKIMKLSSTTVQFYYEEKKFTPNKNQTHAIQYLLKLRTAVNEYE